MSGRRRAGVLTGSGLAVLAIFIGVPVAIYLGWQFYKGQVHSRADGLVQQAEATMSIYGPDQKNSVMSAIAEVRTAKRNDETSNLSRAADELEQAMGKSPSSSRTSRHAAVAYPTPKFLLHIQAIAERTADGQGYEWKTGMYYSGQWVTATREPDANGQVDLVWLGAIPVRCLADQRYGPFSNSNELCPRIKQVGARFGKEDIEKLGCT
jgi:hypothetical protein